MSDSSTAAMLSKEQVKICVNCGNSCGHKTKLYGCVYSYVPCLLNGTFEHECNYCSDWIPRTDTLEQVAREMDALIHKLCAECNFLDRHDIASPNRKANRGARVKEMRDRLKALGVVDD